MSSSSCGRGKNLKERKESSHICKNNKSVIPGVGNSVLIQNNARLLNPTEMKPTDCRLIVKYIQVTWCCAVIRSPRQAESEDFLNECLCLDADIRRPSRRYKHKMIDNLYFGFLLSKQSWLWRLYSSQICVFFPLWSVQFGARRFWRRFSIRQKRLTTYSSCHDLCLFVTNLNSHSLSPPLCLCLSLPFRAVAREAGRIRSLAADEGHGEKTGIAHK